MSSTSRNMAQVSPLSKEFLNPFTIFIQNQVFVARKVTDFVSKKCLITSDLKEIQDALQYLIDIAKTLSDGQNRASKFTRAIMTGPINQETEHNIEYNQMMNSSMELYLEMSTLISTYKLALIEKLEANKKSM